MFQRPRLLRAVTMIWGCVCFEGAIVGDMETTPHILIVDDDREIRDLLGRFLDKHGLRTTTVADGREMKKALADWNIDLIVLDLMLPGEDGLTLCRNLRAESKMPIIMLTAMGEETDRIIGLEMGADDYLAKPFNPRELLARVRSVLRRLAAMPKTEVGQSDVPTEIQRYTFRDWQFDVLSRTLTSPDGDTVTLSSGEFNLLKALVEHPNRVLSRDQLLDFTHGMDTPAFDRSVDVQVVRLRKKIEPNPQKPEFIKTVRNAGYIFATKVERS